MNRRAAAIENIKLTRRTHYDVIVVGVGALAELPDPGGEAGGRYLQGTGLEPP